MSYHALLEYVRSAKDIGASDVEIADRLGRAGWYRVDVRDALELYHRLTANTSGTAYAPQPNPPKPSLAERIAPRHYSSHIVAVAAISFVVGYLAYVWLVTD